MAAYFARRIELGKLPYNTIVKGFPDLKDDIDEILAADGYEVLPDGTVKKVEG